MVIRAVFKDNITLFQDLPEDLYNQLDLSGFFLPKDDIAKLRTSLEDKLGHYVVTYYSHIFNLEVPPETHLCGLVKGALLDKKQLALLHQYEKMTKQYGVTLVVYQKPLALIPLQNSVLYQEYLRKGLL